MIQTKKKELDVYLTPAIKVKKLNLSRSILNVSNPGDVDMTLEASEDWGSVNY